MDCYYINLDGAAERRAVLERNFAQCRGERWTLSRFPATDAARAAAQGIAGTLRPAEKACFLSHRDLIRSQLADPQPVFILEDDAALGARTCGIVDDFVQRNGESDWDIAYTDVCVPQVESMVNLVRLRQRWSKTGGIMMLDLAGFPYVGATAYLVNGRSKHRLSQLLDAVTVLDTPYDLYLRSLIHGRQLRALVFFPFITTLSPCAGTSQIQPAGLTHELVWNTFRQLIWIERTIEPHRCVLEDIRARLCDAEALPFATLFAAIASRHYNP
jgi:GR25 family glycosyltransferase involved in LPS biosynthesis